MKTVFADTAYWVAILNPQDQWNSKAREVGQNLGEYWNVTSEMILTELLNYFSDEGQHLRQAAVKLVQRIMSHANFEIVPQTSSHFGEALELYQNRLDKEWSLTDCSSFLIMGERSITEALTTDHHFDQAGFSVLLTE